MDDLIGLWARQPFTAVYVTQISLKQSAWATRLLCCRVGLVRSARL